MVKTREFSLEERSAMATEHNLGTPLKVIAKKYKCHVNTILYQVRKKKQHDTVRNVGTRQRSRITTQRQDTRIVRTMLKDQHLSQRALAKSIQSDENIQISQSTVCRRLKEAGIKAYVCTKKNFISPKNKIKRIQFAKQYGDKPLAFWHNVLFTDESSVSLDGSWGKKYFYSSAKNVKNRRIFATKRQGGGGNIMIHGCISYNGVGPLAMISDKLNQITYLDLLNEVILLAGDALIGPRFILQQDNAPAHKGKVVTAFLKGLEQNCLDWPPESPDLNIIENVWAYVKNKLPYRIGRTKQELWDEIVEIWSKIPVQFIHKLYESIPRRLAEVKKNKGGQTSY